MKRWMKELGEVGERQLVAGISLMLQKYRGLQNVEVNRRSEELIMLYKISL